MKLNINLNIENIKLMNYKLIFLMINDLINIFYINSAPPAILVIVHILSFSVNLVHNKALA